MKLILSFLITLFIPFLAFSVTISDIKSMRDFDVLISFEGEKEPKKIPINMLPEEFIKANYLGLNGIEIYTIPEWLPKMMNLRRLDLSNTKINFDEINKLSSLNKLEILDLSNNHLFTKQAETTREETSGELKNEQSIVDVLSNFQLIELNLANVGGKSIHFRGIESLTSLKKLDLSYNNIFEKDLLVLNNLVGLIDLNLSGNKVTYSNKLTAVIPHNSLVNLHLSDMKLEEFDFKTDFPKLKYLDLTANPKLKIDAKYGSVFYLKHLVHLKADRNVNLPDGLKKKLAKFQELSLKRKKENLAAKRIAMAKKVGLDKTHDYIEEGTIDYDGWSSSLILVPNNDIEIKNKKTELGKCIIEQDTYKRITIKAGSKLTVEKALISSNKDVLDVSLPSIKLSCKVSYSAKHYNRFPIDRFISLTSGSFSVYLLKAVVMAN